MLYAVQLGKVLLCPLDFAAQAGKLEVGEGSLCKGRGALDCLVHFGGGFVGEVPESLHGFVLAVVGVHSLALVKRILETLQAVLQHFAGVGVRRVDGAGANALDLGQDALDFVVFVHEGFAAGVLLFLLADREVTAAGNEDGGTSGLVAVVVVVVGGKAAGIALQKCVQLFVIESADFLLPALHQGGGLVHGGAVFGGGAAGAVVPHGVHVVCAAGGFFVDFVIHGVSSCVLVLGPGVYP